MNKFSF